MYRSDRFIDAACDRNFEAFFLQEERQGFADDGFIIHQQKVRSWFLCAHREMLLSETIITKARLLPTVRSLAAFFASIGRCRPRLMVQVQASNRTENRRRCV